MNSAAQRILSFWREAGPSKWWKKDPDFDQQIKQKFALMHQQASHGDLNHWLDNAEGALALILLLDQFSRNMFRQQPAAFAQDPKAVKIVKDFMSNPALKELPEDIGFFFYMPLMHSENLEDQRLCLTTMQGLNSEGTIKAAKEHLDIIEEFGRFPHRNTILGRQTTPQEEAFLKAGGFAG